MLPMPVKGRYFNAPECDVLWREIVRLGVPLAIHAGADYPKWILQELLGQRPRIQPAAFRDDIAMLRFDDSVFVPGSSRLDKKSPTKKRRKK